MLRKLTLVAMVCLGVCAMTGTSEAAGPQGRSFKVEGSEGTKAGIAFAKALVTGDVQVHTPEGDFNGKYIAIGQFTVAFAIDNGYVGGFSATVVDPTPNTPGTAKISGLLVGSTGAFTFKGQAKN